MHRIGVPGNIIYMVVHRYERGGIITEESSDMMMMMVVPIHILMKKGIISMATFSLLLLENLPSLPSMCEKASLMIVEEKLMRLMDINYLAGENDILLMKSWNL